MFTGALRPGKVYSGGSSDAFCKYTRAKGKVTVYKVLVRCTGVYLCPTCSGIYMYM